MRYKVWIRVDLFYTMSKEGLLLVVLIVMYRDVIFFFFNLLFLFYDGKFVEWVFNKATFSSLANLC